MTKTQKSIIWRIISTPSKQKQEELIQPLLEDFFSGQPLMILKTIKKLLKDQKLASYQRIIDEGFPMSDLVMYSAGSTVGQDDYTSLLSDLAVEYQEAKLKTINTSDLTILEEDIAEIKRKVSILSLGSSQDIGSALVESINSQSGDSAIDLDKIAKTGIPSIDNHYHGFIPGDLVVIGGFSGAGKSTLLFTIITTLAAQEQSLFYSGEMTKQAIVARFLSAKADLPYELALQNGLAHIEHKIEAINRIEERNKAVSEISELKLDLIDKTMPFEQLILEAEKLVKDKGLKYLFIDYIQLLYLHNSKGNQTQDMAYISRELKLFAQRNRVIVFGLAQINKAGMNAEIPGVEHIADSSRIAANSDTVFILYNKKLQEERITHVSVAKSRMFNSGGIYQLDYNHKTKSYA